MPDEARRAIRTGITSPDVAGCGWVMMAVGSHLGSQLGYLPADDGLAAAVVIERRTCSCCRGEPRRRESTPGPSGRSGIAGRSPLPRRGPGHAAAGRVAPDRLTGARQDDGEPALKPPQGALQVPVVRVAVDPAPLRHEVRELPARLRVRLPAGGNLGHVRRELDTGDLLDPLPQGAGLLRVLVPGQAGPVRRRGSSACRRAIAASVFSPSFLTSSVVGLVRLVEAVLNFLRGGDLRCGALA